MPNARALFMLSALLILMCATRVSARDEPSAPPPLTPEQRALMGPRTAIGWGAILLTAAPIVGIVAAIKVSFDGANFLGCEDWISGATDSQCEADEAAHDAKVDEQMPWVIAGTSTLAVGGAALLGLGIARVVKVRRALRREELLRNTQLSLTSRGAYVGMRLRF